MPGRRHAAVEIELLALQGEPITGLWCASCSLPSGVDMAFLARLNGRDHGVLRVAACTDCGKVIDDV